jgi:hypothetical protein
MAIQLGTGGSEGQEIQLGMLHACMVQKLTDFIQHVTEDLAA